MGSHRRRPGRPDFKPAEGVPLFSGVGEPSNFTQAEAEQLFGWLVRNIRDSFHYPLRSILKDVNLTGPFLERTRRRIDQGKPPFDGTPWSSDRANWSWHNAQEPTYDRKQVVRDVDLKPQAPAREQVPIDPWADRAAPMTNGEPVRGDIIDRSEILQDLSKKFRNASTTSEMLDAARAIRMWAAEDRELGPGPPTTPEETLYWLRMMYECTPVLYLQVADEARRAMK
jgi:hypothetical protein